MLRQVELTGGKDGYGMVSTQAPLTLRVADFVFGDAATVSCAELGLAGQPLASHVHNIFGLSAPTRGVAATILTLNKRDDINVLADLQGKTVGLYDNGNGNASQHQL